MGKKVRQKVNLKKFLRKNIKINLTLELLEILKFFKILNMQIRNLLQLHILWILKKKKLTSIKTKIKEVFYHPIQNIVGNIIKFKKMNKLYKMLKLKNMIKNVAKGDRVMNNV